MNGQPFFALIVPMPGGGSPPGIWGGANQPFPTPPIHMPPGGGGSPPGIWGGANQPFPTPPIYVPPGGGGGVPTHPIYYPPGIWGGANQPFPTPPIHMPPGGSGSPPTIWPSPGHPEHPIYLPPGIWPNPPEGQAPHPEHPIVIPPPGGVPPNTPPLQVKVVWTPQAGWQVVLIPTGTHPAPSQKK